MKFSPLSQIFLIFVFGFLLAVAASAQGNNKQPTPPQQQTSPTSEEADEKPISVKIDLVTLTVTDLYGRFVSGLEKKAFTVPIIIKHRTSRFSLMLTRPSRSVFCLTFPAR